MGKARGRTWLAGAGRGLRWGLGLGLSLGLLAGLMLWLYVTLAPLPHPLEGVSYSPLVLDRAGGLLRMGLTPDHKYREYLPPTAVPPHLRQAVLLYEDKHFARHPGVNPFSLVRALAVMLTGGRRMGASTLAMQVARLRYGLVTTSLSGKLEQMLLALRLTYHHGREAVVQAYFHLAPYGGNVEGLGAAARIYFQRPAVGLTPTQALALAVIPQNPGKRGLHREQSADLLAARQWAHTLWNASQPGSVAALAPPLRVFGVGDLPFAAPHVSAEVLGQANVLATTQAGQTEQTRQAEQGGAGVAKTEQAGQASVLATTIDAGQQALLTRALQQFTARGRSQGLHNAAALLLHWPSMEIRALAGSARFHDAAIAGQVDGTRARRSPGSTLKPFIYALALDQGRIHPHTLLVDAPRSFGGYNPENFDGKYRGPLPAQQALRASRNIPAIWLASQLSPDLYTFLRRAGVELGRDAAHYGLSLVLGGAEVTMRELAGLYALLPNGGVWRRPRLLQGSDPGEGADNIPLLSPEAALVTLRMLEEPGRNVRTRHGSLPLRYKTGTSNRFRDAWTAGMVGPYILVVWLGNFDNSSNPLLVGGAVAAPLFEDISRALALEEKPQASHAESLRDPLPAQEAAVNVLRLPVCADTGDVDVSLCRDTVESLFIPGRSPSAPSGIYRRIWLEDDTGLRLCGPAAGAREVLWEFWPEEWRDLYAKAGVHKPAPPQLARPCPPLGEEGGRAPRILSPREGLEYQRRLSDPGRNAVVLTASADADAATLFWFAGQDFVGSGPAQQPLLWRPEDGEYVLRVVDDKGRAALRTVRVRTLP